MCVCGKGGTIEAQSGSVSGSGARTATLVNMYLRVSAAPFSVELVVPFGCRAVSASTVKSIWLETVLILIDFILKLNLILS